MTTLIDALKGLRDRVRENEGEIMFVEDLSEIIAEHERSGGWLPIDSAPKDFTRVMLWFQVDPAECINSWTQPGSWEIDQWEDDDCSPFVYPPTHWQPLPKGPK